MPPKPNIPLAQRTAQDVIETPGERFLRGELDRPIEVMERLLIAATRPGKDFTATEENTPSYAATLIARETGKVAIAAIGCGTGNELLTCGREVAAAVPCKLGRIGMTGLSRRDYSRESQNPEVLRACTSSPTLIRYLIGNGHNMPEIPSNSQDVTFAFNSLQYATHPEIWLTEMLRITRPGGTVFFNADPVQLRKGKPLLRLVSGLFDAGWPVISGAAIFTTTRYVSKKEGGGVQRTSERTELYRLDIPQT